MARRRPLEFGKLHRNPVADDQERPTLFGDTLFDSSLERDNVEALHLVFLDSSGAAAKASNFMSCRCGVCMRESQAR